MKGTRLRLAALLAFAAVAAPLQARPGLGLTGASSFKLTSLAGQFTVLDGGGTRLVVPLGDGALYLGAGGYTSHEGPRLDGDLLGCMYGGLWGEYDFAPRRLVHLSLGLLAAAGVVGRIHEASEAMTASPAVVLEPELTVSLNLAAFVRLAVGVSYRLAVPFQEVPGLGVAASSAPALTLQLRPISPQPVTRPRRRAAYRAAVRAAGRGPRRADRRGGPPARAPIFSASSTRGTP